MFKKYLKPTDTIDSQHPDIISTSTKIVKNCAKDWEKAKRLFYFVRDDINYNMYAVSTAKEAYKASAILKSRQGWCLQKAILLAALARAVGIPARVLVTALKNHRAPDKAIESLGTDLFFPHAYNDFFLNGKWIKVAATFNEAICKRMGVPTVEFDGKNDAILAAKDLKGQPYIEYLDYYGAYADVPWDFIVTYNEVVYGERYKYWFQKEEFI